MNYQYIERRPAIFFFFFFLKKIEIEIESFLTRLIRKYHIGLRHGL